MRSNKAVAVLLRGNGSARLDGGGAKDSVAAHSSTPDHESYRIWNVWHLTFRTAGPAQEKTFRSSTFRWVAPGQKISRRGEELNSMLRNDCDALVSGCISLGRVFFLVWDKMTQRHGLFPLK